MNLAPTAGSRISSSMHLVQIFLPLRDNEGKRFSPDSFKQVREQLVEQFKGLTAHSRAPADGLWKAPDERTSQDEIVIYEVMVADLDRGWWERFRKSLETAFRQETVLIRASEVVIL